MSPIQHLNAISKKYPAAWKNLEVFLNDSDDLPSWPSWCFMPIAAFHSIISQSSAQDLRDIAKLTALGTWRYSQRIYKFNESLYRELTSTTISGDLPCDVLLRLPEWCMLYIPKKSIIDYYAVDHLL